jgi:hypothetical protein
MDERFVENEIIAPVTRIPGEKEKTQFNLVV